MPTMTTPLILTMTATVRTATARTIATMAIILFGNNGINANNGSKSKNSNKEKQVTARRVVIRAGSRQ